MNDSRPVDLVADRYVAESIERYPELATSLGAPGHDHEWNDYSPAELDAFVAEQRISAELIGADPAAAPASMAELGAYYERMKPALYACDEAKQALRLTFRPPVPRGNRALKLGLPPVSALAFATLPRWARQLYGRPDGPLSDMAATAGLRAARLAFDRQWLFRPAMRAVHRAETAGDPR